MGPLPKRSPGYCIQNRAGGVFYLIAMSHARGKGAVVPGGGGGGGNSGTPRRGPVSAKVPASVERVCQGILRVKILLGVVWPCFRQREACLSRRLQGALT